MKNNKKKTDSTYSIWKRYQDFINYNRNFISQLYLETPLKKTTGRQKVLKYLSKLLIVFLGAFFTTLTFYFLIDPNGLYNSGLNGLLQAFSKWATGSDKISWASYYFLYYGLGLLTNLFFIFILRAFFKAKLEIISTSLFYVLSQIIWTQLFNILGLREYIFNRFNPTTWQTLSGQSQLSFTLPYYIVIAMVAAIIHTYGYSLIFQAQATPGGLEIFTSHFSAQKKRKISLSFLIKIFGIVIIFLVTLFNFIFIEGNTKIKKKNFQKEIALRLKEAENQKLEADKSEEKVDDILHEWKKDMKKANQLIEQENRAKEGLLIRNSTRNRWLTPFLQSKLEEPQLENYPQEVDYYLLEEKEKTEKISQEIEKIEKEINSLTNKDKELISKEITRKNSLIKKKEKLEEKRAKSNFVKDYLIYVTNNERLWATLVYIFLSSFLISQIFPRDKMVLLRLTAKTEENRNRGLKLLAKFAPVYYPVSHLSVEKGEVTYYMISCQLSKWNYYLLLPYLKQVGSTSISEAG